MFFDILISMITGLYSGLIASKYIRYVHAKAQAIQLVKQAEHLHGHDEQKIATLRNRDLDQLGNLVYELEGLGYRAMASAIRGIERTLREADSQSHTTDQVRQHVDAWIDKLRHQHPAVIPTLMAWRI